MITYFFALLCCVTLCSDSLSNSYENVWYDQHNKLSIVNVQTMQEQVFKNLQLCYECEFSPITHTLMTINGEYDQEELASHWSVQYDLYVFYINDVPAGFAVINYGSMVEKNADVHDVGEFYITPIFRKKEFGKKFAHALFKRYSGTWEVRQLPELEKTSRYFWLSVIADVEHKDFQEIINHPQWEGFVQRFIIQC